MIIAILYCAICGAGAVHYNILTRKRPEPLDPEELPSEKNSSECTKQVPWASVSPHLGARIFREFAARGRKSYRSIGLLRDGERGMLSAFALPRSAVDESNFNHWRNISSTNFERNAITRKLTLPILLLAFAGTVFGAEPITIDLKDGGKVVIEEKGTMIHMDAAGNRLKMRDGKVMIAKDGSKVMMKNNAIWQTLSEHGTLKPGH